MTPKDQLPPLPTPKFTETIRGVPCITVTEHEHLMHAYALAALAQQAQEPVAVAGASLLRQPVSNISEISKTIPGGCYCPPGICQAPIIMGRQTPCMRRDTTPQPQPAPSPQAPGRRKGPPGITLEPQSHEQTGDNFSATPKMVQTPHDIDALIDRVSGAICLSHSAWDIADARVLVLEILKQAGPLYTTPPSPQPAVPVVSDEQIRTTVESIQDPDTVNAFHNGYYTLTPEELRRAILALRPQAESKTYADGTTATGVAPLPDVSPAEQDAIQAEGLLNDLEAMLGGRSGASIKLRSLIRPLRPQAVPMTPDHIWANDGIMSANGIIGFKFDAVIRIVRAVEAHHGITAKAEGAKP